MIWLLLVLSISLVSSINGKRDDIDGGNLLIRLQSTTQPPITSTPLTTRDVSASESTAASRKERISFDDCKIVIFDLETTGLEQTDEICQIAACTDDTSFSTYILPSIPISRGASTITGLRLINGDLYLHDKKVESFSARDGFLQFLSYLQSFNRPIILVAHNGAKFDAPRILRLASNLGLLNEFKLIVKGFADSLIIARNVLKKRNEENKKFSIASLANDFLPGEDTSTLHNALSDVTILNKILKKIVATDEIIKSHTESIQF